MCHICSFVVDTNRSLFAFSTLFVRFSRLIPRLIMLWCEMVLQVLCKTTPSSQETQKTMKYFWRWQASLRRRCHTALTRVRSSTFSREKNLDQPRLPRAAESVVNAPVSNPTSAGKTTTAMGETKQIWHTSVSHESSSLKIMSPTTPQALQILEILVTTELTRP